MLTWKDVLDMSKEKRKTSYKTTDSTIPLL